MKQPKRKTNVCETTTRATGHQAPQGGDPWEMRPKPGEFQLTAWRGEPGHRAGRGPPQSVGTSQRSGGAAQSPWGRAKGRSHKEGPRGLQRVCPECPSRIENTATFPGNCLRPRHTQSCRHPSLRQPLLCALPQRVRSACSYSSCTRTTCLLRGPGSGFLGSARGPRPRSVCAGRRCHRSGSGQRGRLPSFTVRATAPCVFLRRSSREHVL